MCFSALQRAENSSIRAAVPSPLLLSGVSVLFSEPKIPQFGIPREKLVFEIKFQCSSASRKFLNDEESIWMYAGVVVSVLFSEPKIPQLDGGRLWQSVVVCFSALQRAENSSMVISGFIRLLLSFVSVLFSEPKIPQYSQKPT